MTPPLCARERRRRGGEEGGRGDGDAPRRYAPMEGGLRLLLRARARSPSRAARRHRSLAAPHAISSAERPEPQARTILLLATCYLLPATCYEPARTICPSFKRKARSVSPAACLVRTCLPSPSLTSVTCLAEPILASSCPPASLPTQLDMPADRTGLHGAARPPVVPSLAAAAVRPLLSSPRLGLSPPPHRLHTPVPRFLIDSLLPPADLCISCPPCTFLP